MRIKGQNIEVSSIGGTHEDFIGAEITGIPAGIFIDYDLMFSMLRRRQGGGPFSTPRKEDDIPIVLRGVSDDITTGDLITVHFKNKNFKNDTDEDCIPRPGHGDYPYYMNTGVFKKGATSARSTIGFVFAGALAKQYLEEQKNITISSRLLSIGNNLSKEEIEEIKKNGDSVGGRVETIISGLPVGFGNPNGPKLESTISQFIMDIPAVKGIEFGDGFMLCDMLGSQANDPLFIDGREIIACTTHCGGVIGGMAIGDVAFTAAFKPTPTIKVPQNTVNLKTMQKEVISSDSDNDVCVAIRGAVVVEAMTALAILDIVLGQEKG